MYKIKACVRHRFLFGNIEVSDLWPVMLIVLHKDKGDNKKHRFTSLIKTKLFKSISTTSLKCRKCYICRACVY